MSETGNPKPATVNFDAWLIGFQDECLFRNTLAAMVKVLPPGPISFDHWPTDWVEQVIDVLVEDFGCEREWLECKLHQDE